jgi:hypothetical protein
MIKLQIKQLAFIPFNVPSSKNSKQKTKTGLIVNGKAVAKYLRLLGVKSYSCRRGSKYMEDYKTRPNIFAECMKDWIKPEGFSHIGFHFVRQTMTLFDFNNMTQIIQDLMVAGNYLDEDNINVMLPVNLKLNGKRWNKNKDNPGIYIAELIDYPEFDLADYYDFI